MCEGPPAAEEGCLWKSLLFSASPSVQSHPWLLEYPQNTYYALVYRYIALDYLPPNIHSWQPLVHGNFTIGHGWPHVEKSEIDLLWLLSHPLQSM